MVSSEYWQQVAQIAAGCGCDRLNSFFQNIAFSTTNTAL